MLEMVKQKAALFLATRKYLKKPGFQSFNGCFRKSSSLLVVMPENEEDFNHAVKFVEVLARSNKQIHMLVKEHKVSTLPHKDKYIIIDYGAADYTRLSLPSRKITDLLAGKQFDAVIDLNIGDSLYCSIVSGMARAYYRIGFKKKESDRFYNLQFAVQENNSANSYRNLLNSLQMF